MGLDNIKPTGEDSVLGTGRPQPEASDAGAPVANSPGFCSAGPVGAVAYPPNPYKVPGGPGADAALEPESNVVTQPPYAGGKAATMTSQERDSRLRQAARIQSAPKRPRTHNGVPITHPTAAGTVGHVPLPKNPRKKK